MLSEVVVADIMTEEQAASVSARDHRAQQEERMMDKVDFWFDPSCPWTWITSRWVVEVSGTLGFDVEWHPFSLGVLNEGRDLDPEYRRHMDNVWGAARVTTAVTQFHGQDKLAEFYTTLGTLIHPRKRGLAKNDAPVIAEALEQSGLPGELLAYATNTAMDPAMRSSTRQGLDLVGDEVGVPIIAINGVGFFGPVISPAPKGQAAIDLWHGCLAVAKTQGFFEIKRSRNVDPIF